MRAIDLPGTMYCIETEHMIPASHGTKYRWRLAVPGYIAIFRITFEAGH